MLKTTHTIVRSTFTLKFLKIQCVHFTRFVFRLTLTQVELSDGTWKEIERVERPVTDEEIYAGRDESSTVSSIDEVAQKSDVTTNGSMAVKNGVGVDVTDIKV